MPESQTSLSQSPENNCFAESQRSSGANCTVQVESVIALWCVPGDGELWAPQTITAVVESPALNMGHNLDLCRTKGK